MEFFENPAVVWFLAGFVFLLLEFLVPGLILFFFGVGAWIVALLLLVFDFGINTQLAIFAASSILSILVFRNWLKELVWQKGRATELEDEFIGKIARAETAIGPGREGKVEFKGTTWGARSEDVIEDGENVIITGNDSIILLVKSTKTL